MKPLLVTSGEPAGIGPDICLNLSDLNLPIVVLGDPNILRARAKVLGKTVRISEYDFNEIGTPQDDHLWVWPIDCPTPVQPGVLDVAHAHYVRDMLRCAAQSCLDGRAAAVITAPVHKGIMNQAGIGFSGHTEFFADLCGTQTVMLLVSQTMRVSLLTTHLPLHAVPTAITPAKLHTHLNILYHSLQRDFDISDPKIKVLGLNPHAGEEGYLGQEEQITIQPVVTDWQQRGKAVFGPVSADTAFINAQSWDALVAMYHDQGLPVLKFASFGHAVNMTCGLPFIRTSVDHGTALDLAGTGRASAESLRAAIQLANQLVKRDA